MREITNPSPADAATIPAAARSIFHLPPAAAQSGVRRHPPFVVRSAPRRQRRGYPRRTGTACPTPSAKITHPRPPTFRGMSSTAAPRPLPTTYRDMSPFRKRFHNPLPADAVTIPASARGAFHLQPTASLSHDQQRHAVDIANAV